MVITTFGDCHKLLAACDNTEHDVTLIVTNIWPLLSQIIGETPLIVTNIWPNHTGFFLS